MTKSKKLSLLYLSLVYPHFGGDFFIITNKCLLEGVNMRDAIISVIDKLNIQALLMGIRCGNL